MVKLPEKDPLFLDRVLVVDADTTVTQEASARGNIVKLPNVPGTTGVARSLENTIKQFLRDISNTPDGPLRKALLALNTPNPTSDKVHVNFFQDGDGESTKREKTKIWWKKHWTKLNAWGVIEQWSVVYEAEVEKFEVAFEAALSRTASRMKNKG